MSYSYRGRNIRKVTVQSIVFKNFQTGLFFSVLFPIWSKYQVAPTWQFNSLKFLNVNINYLLIVFLIQVLSRQHFSSFPRTSSMFFCWNSQELICFPCSLSACLNMNYYVYGNLILPCFKSFHEVEHMIIFSRWKTMTNKKQIDVCNYPSPQEQ